MPMRTDDSELWYRDAIIYETHVRSFYDSNGDGIGDFQGLTLKLPYLRDLGITAIWILPFYPSPLRDDGYDIADYCTVHPNYGTLADFRQFLDTAHSLGLRVITELVLNHTSDQHPWFQKSRRAKPGSPWRDFYVWSDTPDRYADARIIFQDFEHSNWSWDPVAKAYYWHRFYSHQPDLNFENPRVHRALFRVLDFWLGMGVDGLRLDAIPYLYEREGTNCENLPETYQFLKKLRAHVDGKYRGRMLLAEANQWPEDAVSYFGDGEACHMAFHFPLMPRMFMAVQMEDSFPITNILEQTPSIPKECQWGLFLRNHDELTLEMVTDEERDYMYRVYARDVGARINLGIRRRLAPLMGNDRRKIEMMNVLLFALPGTPIIYYGDEIGMGDNYYLGDRNGVRTPMQWSPDRNAGFSPANPQSIYLPVIIDPEYHYEVVNVENQTKNPASLLWWKRRLIDLRKRYAAFGRGTLEFLPMDNPKIIAFVRQYEAETVLIVVNLSRFTQVIEITSPRFAGLVPEDLFSHNRFPAIKNSPYVLIIGPHDYHLFMMHKEKIRASATTEGEAARLVVKGSWDSIMKGRQLERLEQSILPDYLKRARWYGGKALRLSRIRVTATLPLALEGTTVYLTLMEASYLEGVSETYLLPLHFREQPEDLQKNAPEAILAYLQAESGEGVLYDGTYHPEFRAALFDLFARKAGVSVDSGEVVGNVSRNFTRLLGGKRLPLDSHIGKVEQSNTTIFYDSTFFFKFFRRVEEDINPEVEISRFLTEKVRFKNTPPFAGTLEFRRTAGKPMTLGVLQGFVANQGDGWTFTLHEINQYLERLLSHPDQLNDVPELPGGLLQVDPANLPPVLHDLIGGFYPEMAALLGKRTGELHLALAARRDDRAFAPEPYSLLHQRAIHQSIRSQAKKITTLLRKNLPNLPPEIQSEAETVLGLEREILRHAEKFLEYKFDAQKIRIHGDYHLGQVLFTGNDFFIIDFEGEPTRPMSERRIKRSPLRDVAGMIHSFHYAAHAVLLRHEQMRNEEVPVLLAWMEAWHRAIGATFLRAYLEVTADAGLIPKRWDEVEVMLDVFMLDKAMYVLGYELNNRPGWIRIPLREIQGGCEALRREDQREE